MPRPAAIDNDFLSHLVETSGSQKEICSLIRDFFQGLDLSPELHQLIWQYETDQKNPIIRQLLVEKVMAFRALPDILTTRPEGGRYYEFLVRNVYREMTGREYPCDVYTEWRKFQSLGEVHCAVTCLFLNYVGLLSDDKEAKSLKTIMKHKAGRPVQILNRTDCRNYLQGHPDCHNLSSNDLHRLCHIRT